MGETFCTLPHSWLTVSSQLSYTAFLHSFAQNWVLVSGLLLEVAHNPFLPKNSALDPVFCLFLFMRLFFFVSCLVPFLPGFLKLVLFLTEAESIINYYWYRRHHHHHCYQFSVLQLLSHRQPWLRHFTPKLLSLNSGSWLITNNHLGHGKFTNIKALWLWNNGNTKWHTHEHHVFLAKLTCIEFHSLCPLSWTRHTLFGLDMRPHHTVHRNAACWNTCVRGHQACDRMCKLVCLWDNKGLITENKTMSVLGYCHSSTNKCPISGLQIVLW